jgi:hypothetical protein
VVKIGTIQGYLRACLPWPEEEQLTGRAIADATWLEARFLSVLKITGSASINEYRRRF